MSERGVLLVNLGSPKSTQVADVRRYLNQFLMDPYVVDLPWPARRLLVSLILLTRPKASAHAYASIWWEDGSPLLVISRRVQQALQQQLDMPVELAMRYGEPSIEQGLLALAARPGIREVLFMPQYPQHADSTITTSVYEAQRVIKQHGLDIRLNVVPAFYDADYLAALADSMRPYLAQGFDHLLLSYTACPSDTCARPTDGGTLSGVRRLLRTRFCCHATCYRAHCSYVSRELAARLELAPEQCSMAFQSRLGRDKWIEPYTENRIDELAAQGVKRLLVACPAFVADCIETLEEIGDRAREQFVAAGGEELVLIPCLNDDPQWVKVLADWARNTPVQA
ncbi:ferrochelatase [Halopseudomonas pachastrellae]|nr:ferrochelatase [Halopseudomonas pachastrellae]